MPEQTHLHRESGATLVLALAFLAIFGLLIVAVLGFSDASFRAAAGYRSQRASNYGADGALDGAINRVRNNTSIGLDPGVVTGDKCNPSNNQSIFTLPSTSTSPGMVVSCEVQAGSESGLPNDLGTTPPFSILSLGDRRSDGTIGVRNNEPGPYNGTTSGLFNLCTGNRQEYGMRFNTSVTPVDLGILSYCYSEPNATAWNVQGNIFSNSRIQVDPSNAGPVMVTAPDSTSGTIKARGGCTGVTGCTDAGWDFTDGQGKDPGAPGSPTAADYAPRSISGLPVVDESATWAEAQSAACAVGNHIVPFSPGIYSDATRLNQIFGDSRCVSATFWFQPGTYYFDFRAEAVPAASRYLCGNDNNFFGSPGSETAHQWCIAGKDASYSGQRVVGGTPYGWAPQANPTTHVVTLEPAANAGNGSGIFAIFQQSAFAPSANAKSINGATADLTLSGFRSGGSIWLSGYPQVPRGSYGTGLDLEIAYAGTNVPQMNQPTIQVNYGSLFSGGTCGPYTLPKPPANGSISTVKLSVVNPAAATNLAACLNNGDRINTAVVQFNVSRPFFQGSPYPTAKLDGVRFLVTAVDQPTFPRPPSPTDPGGDCDPEKPGVQFIFGGDSHVYVPNGGMELCAGPNPSDAANGKELAVYGVPATPRLVPTTVAATSANDGVTNPNNALRIAEGPGLAPAIINYHGSSGTYEGTMTLRFAGYTPPAGYNISGVTLRASYDANNGCTFLCGAQPAQYELVGLPGSCGTPQNVATGDNRQTAEYDVTSCLTTGNRINSQFDVKWHARWSCFFSCDARHDELDGIEFVVTLAPTDPNASLRPQNGCIVDSPNYYFGSNANDCALLKVDAPWLPTSSRRGRLSIKGTVYAPSAAIDIDDSDVWYPLFSRGLIARHFRLKGFKYHSGYSEPIASTYVNRTPTGREVLFYVCKKDTGPCTPGDPTLAGRAFVTFDAVTNKPTVKTWSVSQH
ncbi:MAG: hypothetical protein ACXVJ4_16710 [Acidimicrobiia bacterium]